MSVDQCELGCTSDEEEIFSTKLLTCSSASGKALCLPGDLDRDTLADLDLDLDMA